MRAKQPELPANTPEEKVRLKPILGIRPGIYLTVLYSIAIIIILFLFLIFPGIKNPGAVLQIKTEPDGAAIRVDGVYMGTAKDKIFVSKGDRTLEAVLPGFEKTRSIHEIPGRVFGSLFFPLRYPVEFTLKTNNPSAVFAEAAADYAAWSFGGEPTGVWQIPLSLSESAYRIGPERNPFTAELLSAAARFTVTRAALRDLVRAKILLDNSGFSPSPSSLSSSISGILQFLSDNPGSAEWLSNLLPAESAVMVKSSDWYKNEYPAQMAVYDSNNSVLRPFEFEGLSFINIKNMFISENPVSQELYETFLNENPSWRKERHINPEEISSYIPDAGNRVTNISWFAAEAFCNWLTQRLPPSMAGMEARLPSEVEWEYAVFNNLINIEFPGWEWCDDPYAPLTFIKASPKAIYAAGSPERSIKPLKQSKGVSFESRASLPSDLSSIILTFRPVIAGKDNLKN